MAHHDDALIYADLYADLLARLGDDGTKDRSARKAAQLPVGLRS